MYLFLVGLLIFTIAVITSIPLFFSYNEKLFGKSDDGAFTGYILLFDLILVLFIVGVLVLFSSNAQSIN